MTYIILAMISANIRGGLQIQKNGLSYVFEILAQVNDVHLEMKYFTVDRRSQPCVNPFAVINKFHLSQKRGRLEDVQIFVMKPCELLYTPCGNKGYKRMCVSWGATRQQKGGCPISEEVARASSWNW